MDIPGISIGINPPASNPVSQITSSIAVAANTKPETVSPPSTVVTLSAAAQKLSQEQTGTEQTSQTQVSNNTGAAASQQTASVPREANESTGIQLIAGSEKGGRISTYA